MVLYTAVNIIAQNGPKKNDGKYYLAKYGTTLDSLPEQKIEYATMKIAHDVGLNVPGIKISEHVGRKVFMIERFDRRLIDGNLKRFHFISALNVHGLLCIDEKWRFAPLYDIFPKPASTGIVSYQIF